MYVDRGGDPRVLDDLRWSDVADWLAVHDLLEVRGSLGGIPEE